ncbi:hypothetical protein [Phytohalomonas tamaricis]|uniref:hypothetical protein n=1 Tax=Phytohalomonas tamaricis TaxID=2081032 RepID=UPI000D0BA2AE|nr:hypothetical protein [Phytohalomonas tamaricis]
MGKTVEVRVTAPNLYRNSRRCAIGETFNVTLNNDGDVPVLYRGKVEIVGEKMTVATPGAKANVTGNQPAEPEPGDLDSDKAEVVQDDDEDFKVRYKGVIVDISRNQMREDGTLTAGGIKAYEDAK